VAFSRNALGLAESARARPQGRDAVCECGDGPRSSGRDRCAAEHSGRCGGARLETVRLVARYQVLPPVAAGAPTWILDVAHNPAAARVLASNLRSDLSAGRTLAVCGILADKDAAGVAAELRDCIDAWWCVPTEGERGRTGAELKRVIGAEVAVRVEAADSTAAGCAAALADAEARDRIVVFGSFHTVAPAIDWLEAHDFLPPAPVPEYTATPQATYV